MSAGGGTSAVFKNPKLLTPCQRIRNTISARPILTISVDRLFISGIFMIRRKIRSYPIVLRIASRNTAVIKLNVKRPQNESNSTNNLPNLDLAL